MSKFVNGRGAGGQESRGEEATTPLPRSPAPLRFLPPVVVTLAAMWLYRRALGFAYFNDDPTGHFAWMEGQALAQFFRSSAEYGYYRPVVFAVLRLFELLFGDSQFPHNPVADHALLIVLHGVNTALLWSLARRLSGSAPFAWVAALAFAFVPFSYEAVAYVASLTHPLVVFWVLLALLLYERGRGAGGRGSRGAGEHRRGWLIGSGAAMVLGLLTHENGLIIFPALVGLDWVARPGETWRRRARALWPYAVPPVLFVALWLAIPKSSEQGLNSLADIGRNAVPFLQTLVYPLLPALRLDAGDVWVLALLAAGVVALSGAVAWRAGAWRLWAFALGWFVLASLPAMFFLAPAYVYGSPRLSYLPAIGVALLWALPVQALDRRQQTTDDGLQAAVSGRRSVVRGLSSVVLIAVYTLAIVLPPLPFIRCQLDFYAETSRIAREMAAAAAVAPAERAVTVVNAPFFFSSFGARPEGCPNPYPWTPVGGIFIPPYADIRDFVRFNSGPDRAVSGVTFAGYGPGWRTFGPEISGEALRRRVAEESVLVFDLLSGSFTDLTALWRPDGGIADAPPASFGDVLQLASVALKEESEWLAVGLGWQVKRPPDAPLAVFVHIYDAGGALVAQSDGPPAGGLAPWELWRPGDGLFEQRRVDLSALPPGRYTVALGVYNPADGVRLEARATGQMLADDLFVVGTMDR